MRTLTRALPALFILLADGPAFPQAVPVTGEILISVSDTASRLRPDVAAAPGGRFVVVWREIAEQDGGISGRWLSAAGVPLGEGFVAAPRDERLQTSDPQVDCRADGGFLAAWGEAAFPRAGCARARSFAADGTAGDAFDLGPCAGGDGRAPAVGLSGLRDGRFTAAWEVEQTLAPTALHVMVRAFPATDTPAGEPLRVDASSDGSGSETAPAAAVDARGRAVVTWIRSDAGALFARRFDGDGVPAAPAFRVDAGLGFPLEAAVAAAPDGRFVAVWSAYLGGGDRFAILAQVFDKAGRKKGAPILVSPANGPYREQHNPDVAMDAQGNFVVVWDAERVDGEATGILGRRFSTAGAALGEPFRINRTGRGLQSHPAVALGRTGRFVVVWDSQRNAAGRGSIVGRLYSSATSVLPSLGSNERFSPGCRAAPLEVVRSLAGMESLDAQERQPPSPSSLVASPCRTSAQPCLLRRCAVP